jgi:hypothetical protein
MVQTSISKNNFETTVFDKAVSEEVEKDSSKKIKELLLQYQRSLKSHKLINV